jgi:hypothetical protein
MLRSLGRGIKINLGLETKNIPVFFTNGEKEDRTHAEGRGEFSAETDGSEGRENKRMCMTPYSPPQFIWPFPNVSWNMPAKTPKGSFNPCVS